MPKQVELSQPDGDDIYAALMAAHEGLDFDQSQKLNAKLILLLINEVGSPDRVKSIIAEARAQE